MKTIVLTGASSGFGLLVLKRLVVKKHRVVATVRGSSDRILHDPALKEAHQNGLLIVLDVHMERPDTFALIKETLSQKCDGRLDALINNAGYGVLRPIELQTPEQIKHQFQVNVFAPIELTRLLLPEIKKAKGRIINISSIAGLMSFPFYGIYSATKHALEAASEALRTELAPFGVQVSLVEPGGFRTEFAKRSLSLGQSTGAQSLACGDYSHWVKNFDQFLDSKKEIGGNPDRVAALIVRLCEQKRIPLHNVIGADAQALKILSAFLPKPLEFWIKHHLFKRQVFKDHLR